MSNTKIGDITIQKAVNMLASKEISSVELVSACLQNVELSEPTINALITKNENALKSAQEADNTIASERDVFNKRPLLGIPIVLKDIYSTKDLRTTAGSKVLDSYLPPFDATVVRRLKEAGAIIIGKSNLDAWAHGSSGENSDYGVTRNPYDTDRTAGGSSSGSAAALAADYCLMSGGTDTGGSIRLPAAFCNLVGLKPTYGRVSRYGIIAMGSSFDSIGHMTKTVYDSAYVLNITAGPDGLDATAEMQRHEDDSANLDFCEGLNDDYNQSMKGKKVGVIKEFATGEMSPGMRESFNKAIKQFEALGCSVEEVSLPHIHAAMAAYYVLVPSEISSNLGRMDGVRFGNTRDTFGDEARRRIMIGTYTLSSGYYDAYYKKATEVRHVIKQDFIQAFSKFDILLAPTSPTSPFKIGEKASDPLSMYLSDIYVCPMNLAGVPALNVPIEPVEGLPAGMQIIAPHFKEKTMYQFAYAFEQSYSFEKPQKSQKTP